MGLDECIMICIHHYNVMQNIFIALKILCTLPVHLFLPSQTQATTHLFTVSVVLPFPECHAVEVTQYVAFSDWLLSLSNMHLRFLPSLPGLIAHFFLVLRLDVI